MIFFTKMIVAAFVIAFASWLSGKKPVLAGFIIALPLASMLAILFSYLQYRDMQKINQFAVSILAAVPLSLFFFVPFILNRWLKFGFALTYVSAVACLAFAYFFHQFILKYNLFK